MTIYDIDEKIRSLIDEETGEVKDEEAFNNLQMEREKKIEGAALLCKELKAEAKALDDEAKALLSRRDVDLRGVERLKKYLAAVLGGAKFKTARVALQPRVSKSVEVDRWEDIPEEYLKYKDPEVNKVEIAKILKSGGEVPGCHLKEMNSVTIK